MSESFDFYQQENSVTRELFAQACAENAARKWINYETRPPTAEDFPILIWWRDSTSTDGSNSYHSLVYGWTVNEDAAQWEDGCTHWMHLPNPPTT